jgi:MFS transporter, DHA2 family, multidrug resistance protein
VGLLSGGCILTVAFLIREMTTARPFLNLPLLLRGNLLLLLLALAALRFIVLSTAYIIPTYLQAVQNFRELQVGQVLLWIALPQLVLALPLAALLRRVDGRYVLALGVGLIGVACLMTAQLTSQWATGDFLPSQIVQAVGQSFALTSLTVLLVRSLVPAEALTIGCLLQISRLFGGEIGTAFMQTFLRVREQLHSNIIGLHIIQGGVITTDRLAAYARALSAHVADPGLVAVQADRLLAMAVVIQANVLAYQDGFLAAALGAVLCLLLIALMSRGRPSLF